MNQLERDRMEAELRRHGELKATPVKNKEAAGVAQALHRLHRFASEPFGYKNPPVELLSELLGIPAVARTLERVGYGEPLTTGSGMTTKPRADTMEAAMAVAPLAQVTRGLPVGASTKAVKEQPMLQGFYRGYAGDYTAPVAAEQTGLAFVSPQRKAAEFYANKRALQTGQEPNVEMVLAEPFAGKAYGHSTPGSGAVEPITTQARKLAPADIHATTPLGPTGEAPPFWYNPEGGQFAPFDASNMHNRVIQDPSFAAKLGTTSEEAMTDTSPLLMGRHRKGALDLMQVPPADENTLAIIQRLILERKLSPEALNLSAGENLFEGIPREELLKALSMEDLGTYKKYAEGGSIEIPSDFTAPDMSDGGKVLPDPDYMSLALQQSR